MHCGHCIEFVRLGMFEGGHLSRGATHTHPNPRRPFRRLPDLASPEVPSSAQLPVLRPSSERWCYYKAAPALHRAKDRTGKAPWVRAAKKVAATATACLLVPRRTHRRWAACTRAYPPGAYCRSTRAAAIRRKLVQPRKNPVQWQGSRVGTYMISGTRCARRKRTMGHLLGLTGGTLSKARWGSAQTVCKRLVTMGYQEQSIRGSRRQHTQGGTTVTAQCKLSANGRLTTLRGAQLPTRGPKHKREEE